MNFIEGLKNSGKVTIDEDHEWGYQLRFVNNEYCGKILVLENGNPGSNHFHKEKTETFIVLAGQVLIELDLDGKILMTGDQITLCPGERHQMRAIDMLSIILEVSTHDDDEDTYRIQVGNGSSLRNELRSSEANNA